VSHWRDPRDVPELAAVLDAIQRGAKRSKLRVLDVACAHDHRLIEVFTTPAGPVALGRCREPETVDPWAAPGEKQVGWFSRNSLGALPLALAVRSDTIAAQCRCREALIPVGWLLDQLAGDTRRTRWIGVRN
jgi:hypothetical protein